MHGSATSSSSKKTVLGAGIEVDAPGVSRRYDHRCPKVNIGAGTITCNYDGVKKQSDGHRRRRVHRQRLAARSRRSPIGKRRVRRQRHDDSRERAGRARWRSRPGSSGTSKVGSTRRRREKVEGAERARVAREGLEHVRNYWIHRSEGRGAGSDRRPAAARIPRLRFGGRRRRPRWPRRSPAQRGQALEPRGRDRRPIRFPATTAVGHTRWATHGRPTEENAHPHRDCTGKIVVVHNGIIENYLDLKLELQKQGHTFVTETDTEIVAHLVEREMKDDGLENAVRRALLLMRGLFALVLISADDPGKIVTVRNGPPIVVGLGDGEFFVASDIPAILSHTRDVVFLGDEEMAIITPTGVEFTDFFGRPVSKATQRVLWDPIMAEKAGYKHFMLKEIFEQPTAARETILGRVSQDSGKVFLEEMKVTDETLRAIDRVTILACGTSWHAGLVGKFMIEQLARLHGGRRLRLRVPLPAANRHEEHARGRDHAVR